MSTIFQGHEISQEQKNCLTLFKKMNHGDLLTIESGAGASKTFTCSLLISKGAAPYHKALVLAFNRLIVDEMRESFADNVTIVTTHELARMHTNNIAEHRLETPLTPQHVCKALTLACTVGKLDRLTFAEKLITIISRYASSISTSIQRFLEDNKFSLMRPSEYEMLPMFIYYGKSLWEKMCNKNSDIPVLHDVYLKEFVFAIVRGDLTLDYDIVVLDEAQDSAPIAKLLFESLQGKKISAGDTFQSIYEWRGAVNVMEQLAKTTIHSARLTTCYRFGQEIADIANGLIVKFHGRTPNFKGHPSKSSEIIESATEFNPNRQELWLFRTNAELMGELIAASNKGVKCHLLKDNQEYLNLITQAESLFNCNPVSKGVLASFTDWKEFETFAMSEAGGEYKSFVNAVMRYGFFEIRKVIEASANTQPENAQRLFSTAHACKGLEFESVVLSSDFDKILNRSSGRMLLQEVNLLYVALTRAKLRLDISRCKTLIDIIKRPPIKLNKAIMDSKRNQLAELGLL
ncbi:UvrD-helicase domain-containing protein (plasmid) [Vibrio harveyi]|uniref:UvrD-helicase domain-containing protein n=1 Tax=Vibrio harveyi TaxID=669 RepID=UPI0031BAA563